MFSMMSWRRFAGLLEGKGTVPVYLCLKALFAYRFLDDIHLAAQHQRQAPFKLFQTSEIVKSAE